MGRGTARHKPSAVAASRANRMLRLQSAAFTSAGRTTICPPAKRLHAAMSRLTRALARAAIAAAAGAGCRQAPHAAGAADRRRRAADRPVGAARHADPRRRAGGGSAVSPAATLDVADDACTAEGGAAAASDFVAAKVSIVVGFLCTEAIEAALPILKDAGIPVITVGVRTDSLTDRKRQDRLAGLSGWRRAPTRKRNAVASMLIELWRQRTVRHRRRRHDLRPRACRDAALANPRRPALKPVFVDHVPAAARQPDRPGRAAAEGRRDACLRRRRPRRHRHHRPRRGRARLRLDLRRRRDACAPPPATCRCSRHADDRPAGMGRYRRRPRRSAAIRSQGAEPEGYALPAYAAVEIANAANADAEASGGKLLDSLAKGDFTTAIGTIKFDDKGDLSQSPYRLFRFDGTRFVAAECHDVPRRAAQPDHRRRRPARRQRRRRALKSGVTVVVCDEPAVAGVQVLGGAPGTRETDLLEPHNSVEAVNAIVLSGGSAFGLDAASGVQAALREKGHRLRGRRPPHADRAGGDPVRPAQWRRQGLGPLSALSRARLRGGRRPPPPISRSAPSAPAPAR